MGRQRKPTSYGRLVLSILKKRDMRLWELAEEVEAKTGRFVDANFLYNYLCGVPTPWRIREAVNEILGLKSNHKEGGIRNAKNPTVCGEVSEGRPSPGD